VEAGDVEDDGEPFPEKLARLTQDLDDAFRILAHRKEAIRGSLACLGYDLSHRRVVDVTLGSRGDKIEPSHTMGETLDAMVKAVFKSWFVDFDPVHAKSRGRQPDRMDAETARLFPSSFQDSEIGQVPKGWKVESLDSIADFLNGLACQRYPPTGNESLPVIKIAELRNGVSATTDRATSSVGADYVIENGDVLFSWSGSLLVKIWTGGKGVLNQHLFKVTSCRFPRWFYFLWVLEHLRTFQSIAEDKATTMGHIKRHHLTEAKVVVPDPEVLKKADAIIAPLFEGVSNFVGVNDTE
jgi:type I restriction enzyme S subunit